MNKKNLLNTPTPADMFAYRSHVNAWKPVPLSFSHLSHLDPALNTTVTSFLKDIMDAGAYVDEHRNKSLDDQIKESLTYFSSKYSKDMDDIVAMTKEIVDNSTKDTVSDDIATLKELSVKERKIIHQSNMAAQTFAYSKIAHRNDDIMKTIASLDVCSNKKEKAFLENRKIPYFYAFPTQCYLASKWLPSSWLKSMNGEKGSISLSVSKGDQSYYQDNMIYLASHEAYASTIVHEMMHHMETQMPYLVAVQRAFLSQRSKNTIKKTTDSYGNEIFVYDASLPVSYAGRVYASGKHCELLSVGMEALLFGSRGGFCGIGGIEVDKEWLHFILGVLAMSS